MARLTKIKSDFAQVSNFVLYDKSLSAKAKGVYAYLYAKPDDWDFSGDRIAAEFSDGRDAIHAALKELEAAGILRRVRQPNGRVAYLLGTRRGEVDITTPHAEPNPEIPQVGKSPSGKIRTVSNTESERNTERKEIPPARAGEESNPEEEKAIGEAIKAFEVFTPEAKKFYARQPQREAARDLIRDPKIGLARVKTALKVLYANREDQFAPLVDSPLELSRKWAKVYRYVKPKVHNRNDD